MFFYQQAGFPSHLYRQPVHRMYMQYQQPYRAAALRRSAVVPSGGVSAYVAGNQVAASGSVQGLLMRALAKKLAPFRALFHKNIHLTYTHSTPPNRPAEADQIEPEIFADDVPVENDDAVSIAEAYPPAEEADEPQQDEADFPVAADVPLAAAAPEAPIVPQNKNKVTVQLDTAAADEDDELTVQHDEVPVYRKPQRRPSSAPASAPAPASNPVYFPINFGNTNGGAIAVANAYSTGQKGGARSHAIAYGSPAATAKKVLRRKATSATAVNE